MAAGLHVNEPLGLVLGTTRPGSTTAKLGKCYKKILLSHHEVEVDVFDLAALPEDFLTQILYQPNKSQHAAWAEWQARVDRLQKFVFVIPEYNGSFPGILKAFVDALKFPTSLRGKYAGMIGISDGTQGAALAMSHFGDVLNYAGMLLLPLRPRLIEINKYWDSEELTHPVYLRMLEEHALSMLAR